MATKVTTLKNAEKTDNLLPRTELNAIFDSDGNYLDSNLKASDLNALKGGTVDELVRFTEDGAGTPIPTDADTLEGHDASYFATADALSSLNSYIGGMLVVDVKTTPTVSVSGGSYESMNTDVTKSGYTALGIVGVSPTTINGVLTAWRFTNAVTVNTYVTNRTSSTISYSANLSILYVKNMS